jgi:DNA invertase Pin-like site-specific DNA recombinase
MNNKNLDTSKLKYIIYCRRSSEEGEDKQVQSLETQLRELTEHAQRNNLNVIKIISESKSAFKIGREGFGEMMTLMKTGKADAILVVRANRISRNPIDAGRVISLMDEKKLLYIRTPNSTCYTSSSSDKMMLAFELIVSKKDSDDKGDMVKEGQKTKALKGMPHGVATLGFLNDKTGDVGNRKWKVDETRLGTIKILLEIFLTGTYSAGKLHKYAVDELKLTTVRRKKTGGELIVKSRIYEILKDPIYAGFFFYGGERYELDQSLPRLITETQHQKIKMLLSKKNIPKTQNHQTLYAGFITSENNEFVGQDVKFQVICDCKQKFAFRNKTHCPNCGIDIDTMENPKYLSYTWYYNVKKKKAGLPCKYLSEAKVDEAVTSLFVENLDFSPEMVEWSKKYIHEMKEEEISRKIVTDYRKEERKIEYQEKKTGSRAMWRDGKITEDEYNEDIEKLNRDYADVIDSTTKKVDWYSRLIEIADLTGRVGEVLKSDNIQSKRNLLSSLGSNLVWNEEKLSIINRKEIDALINGVKRHKSEYLEFGISKSLIGQGLNEKSPLKRDDFSIKLRG